MSSKLRKLKTAKSGRKLLGPLKLLPGVWKNDPSTYSEYGFNTIALPFATEDPVGVRVPDYRLMVSMYNERLRFSTVDENVPNRGITRDEAAGKPAIDTDQFLVALDYDQIITNIHSEDFPPSDKLPQNDYADEGPIIHQEPGFWLHMRQPDLRTENFDIARQASIPHGNSVLAMGRSRTFYGAPKIPTINGLPFGRSQELTPFNSYVVPYLHFRNSDGSLFKTDFEFDPIAPHEILERANKGVSIKRTTELVVDTTHIGGVNGGILNTPFVEKQADASAMRATFWIQELEGSDKLRLQYLQVVNLDFFGRKDDGQPGLVRWPHVSLNTLYKDDDESSNSGKVKMAEDSVNDVDKSVRREIKDYIQIKAYGEKDKKGPILRPIFKSKED